MINPQAEAKKILTQLNLLKRPVDVEEIATRLGATVVVKALEGDDELCGMIFKDNDNIIIGINERHPQTRQRFTLAHEIGHLVMHSHLIGRVHVDETLKEKLYRDGRSKLGEDQMEIEANRFAAELLMPAELLMQDVKGAYIDPEQGPVELAKKYQVSTQAMSIKLMELLGSKYF